MSSKKLVNKATTDDLNAPAGFVLQQLATKTLGSVEECQIIEDLVVKKLDKNKPYVKHKALRIVKYICDNGHPSWRIAWQRHSDKIRACAHFRGPPDPIHGDAPYERVRAAAKEAMDAVFSTTTRDQSAIRSRIKGIGGDAPAAPTSKPPSATFKTGSKGVYSAPTGSNGSKMTGYGNTDYIPKARPDKFKALKDPGTYNASVLGHNRHSTKALDNRHNRSGEKKRARGKVGGVWDTVEDEDDDEEYDDDFQDEPEQPRRTQLGGARVKVGGRVNPVVKSDGSFEQNWVDGVAGGGGVGGRIAAADLKRYVQQFENLSQSHALEALEDKLADGTWQQQAKSLTLIQALLDGASADTVSDFVDDHPECIEDLMEENRSAVRKKAVAIAKIVGLLDDPPPRQAPAAQAPPPIKQQTPVQHVQAQPASPPKEQIDLLGFDSPPAPAAPAAAPSSLFGNLTIQNGQSNGSAPVQPAPVQPTPPVQHVVTQPPPQAVAAVDDMSWMTNLGSTPSNIPKAAPVQKSPAAFDPMGTSTHVTAIPRQQPQAVQPTQPQGFAFVQPPTQPAASSFGFMGQQPTPSQPQPSLGMGMGMGMHSGMTSMQPGVGSGMNPYGMGSMNGMGMNGGMGRMGMNGMNGYGTGMVAQPMVGQMPMMSGYGASGATPALYQTGDPFSTLLDPSPKAPPTAKQTQKELFSEFSLK